MCDTERRTLLTQDASLVARVTAAASAVGPVRSWLTARAYALDVVAVPRTTPSAAAGEAD
ncbi:hypothetical protein GCM10022287_06930 [Gryllotalpicola koreensis]|uniref:Uncharacterized protein n=1 Tax=Gryllotalpicola koreensis TaxID=993086 RepID=A0ABP7ZT97_9MICO